MKRLERDHILAIIRAVSSQQAVDLGAALLSSGLSVVEVSLTTPRALAAIEQLRIDFPEQIVGAGTVLDGGSATMAIHAGAQILVSPGWSSELARTAQRYGVPAIAGCATPSEVMNAMSSGADAIKVFPAVSWSPGAMRALREALPQAPFVPTGGISMDQARDWIEAGAIAIGVGSALTSGGAEDVNRRVKRLRESLTSTNGPV